jgi:hypothetical protein
MAPVSRAGYQLVVALRMRRLGPEPQSIKVAATLREVGIALTGMLPVLSTARLSITHGTLELLLTYGCCGAPEVDVYCLIRRSSSANCVDDPISKRVFA